MKQKSFNEPNQELNAIIVYGLRIGGALLAFILQIFLARWIGHSEYGLFAFVWASLIIVGEILNFGYYNLIQRLIQEYGVKQDKDHLRGAIWSSAIIVAGVSILVALLSVLTLYGLWHTELISQKFAIPLMIAALALPAFALSDYISGLGRAYGAMISAFAPTALLRPLVIISLLAGLASFSLTLNAVTAMMVATIAIWLSLAVAILVTKNKIPHEHLKGPRQVQLQSWFWAALPMMLISGFELLLFNIDVLMISMFLPSDQTGIYFAAAKIMALVAFINFAVGSAFNAAFAKHSAAGEQTALAGVIHWSASLTFYPSIIALLLIYLCKVPLLSLFGPAYIEASFVVLPLCLGLLLRALVGPGERILMMSGQHYLCAAFYLGAVILDMLLNAILIPQYGIGGAAVATALSFSVMALALLITIRTRLGIWALPFLPHQMIGKLKSKALGF